MVITLGIKALQWLSQYGDYMQSHQFFQLLPTIDQQMLKSDAFKFVCVLLQNIHLILRNSNAAHLQIGRP